jgi:NAD(P)-dependent dehydrogenase (short-subunit alcohol dehydrogenase family)
VPAIAAGGEDPAGLGERDRRMGAGGESLTLGSGGRGFDSVCVAAHAGDRGRHRVRPRFRGGLQIEAVGADIEDLGGYRETLERIFGSPGAPGVVVYNAALPDPGQILETTVERLRTAYDVDVLGGVVAAQVAAPVVRASGGGTLLVTSGGFADNPVPALASLSMGKAALRSAQTLIAAGVREDGIHATTVTIAGAVKPGTDFDPDNIAEFFWTAHTDSKDAWQTEYRFTGA